MTQPAPAAQRPTLTDHARRLGPLQVNLLVGFLVVGLLGAGAYTYAALKHQHATPHKHAVRHGDAMPPAGSSGFLGTAAPADTAVDAAADAPDETAAGDTWAGWGGAKGATLGFGFVGGFALGFIFRAFLKIMALITLVVGGGLAALSYYHVVNIDFTAVQHAYDSNAAWITDQATRFKEVVIAHLPSSGGGAAGFFVGLRRKVI